MEELKYPIKYACKPLYYGSAHINGYIVSKAYIINEQIDYYPDGTANKIYKVVFPYQWGMISKDSLKYFENERQYPKYLYGINPKYNDNCIANASKVNRLFDTYEAAVVYRDKLNEYIKSTYVNESKDQQIKFIIEHFDETLKSYKDFELKLLSLTEDMKVETSVDVYKELLDLENISTERACNTLKKHIK